MTDDFDNMLWSYRATFKQENAGGGSISVVVAMKERCVLLYGSIGKNDYAADRAVTVRIRDEDNLELGFILDQPAVDNEAFTFPVANHSATSPNDGWQFERRMVMAKDDKIVLIAASLVQNEEFTVFLRMLVPSAKPSIATTGSGGTVTVTTHYDKVI